MTKRKFSKPPRLKRYAGTKAVNSLIKQAAISSLSIKLPVRCNLSCTYCYGNNQIGDLKFSEMTKVLKEAIDIGVQSISILGEGEPLLYKNLFQLIDYINNYGIPAIVYTNNTLITEKKAEALFKRNVLVVGKLNSLRNDIQRKISGDKDAYKIFEGLNILKKIGFNRTVPSRLALHTVIISDNYDELCEIWQMCRDENIIPYFQVFVPPARYGKNKKHIKKLTVAKEKVKELFFKLYRIDKDKYGLIWDKNYTYPIPGMGCNVIKSGCAIDSFGNVKLCAYLDESLGNIRNESLKDILSSEKVKKIRGFIYYKNKKNFYGCRTMAFNLTGNRFAKDPFFWQA
ncbi:MAG: radical SAM protein [Candidatus Omnitrophota bacterium]